LTAVERDRRRALIGPDAKIVDFASRLPAALYQTVLAKGLGRLRRERPARTRGTLGTEHVAEGRGPDSRSRP
jgi:hypothetical protein